MKLIYIINGNRSGLGDDFNGMFEEVDKITYKNKASEDSKIALGVIPGCKTYFKTLSGEVYFVLKKDVIVIEIGV